MDAGGGTRLRTRRARAGRRRIPRLLPGTAAAACALATLPAGAHPAAAAGAGKVEPVDAAWVASRLRPGHPRLLLEEGDWARVVEARVEDPGYDAEVAALLAHARATLAAPPLRRELVGRRMLGVSREALRRVLLLAFAYRVGGDAAFLDAAEENLLAVAGFEDWNPDHFLDVAEMAAAVALGLDWLHADLPEATRSALAAALREKALTPALARGAEEPFWATASHNWNPVCYGGLTLAALAVGDEEIVAEVLRRAAEHNPRFLDSYVPDGVFPEGPDYWSYGTGYQVLLIEAFRSALGTDLGLGGGRALHRSGGFFVHTRGPTGLTFNFADADPAAGRRPDPVLDWFAKHLADAELVGDADPAAAVRPDRLFAGMHPNHEAQRLAPLGLLWRTGAERGEPPTLPRSWAGRGVQPVAIFRAAWDDPDAAYLATKGGRARVSHGHMDAGSFVLDALGVRWVRDLGRCDYEAVESSGFEGLFSLGQDSPRWTLLRNHNLGHSTLTLGGRPHRVDGEATLERFEPLEEGGAGVAVYDLSAPLGLPAGTARRVFTFEPGSGVVVEDTLSGLPAGEPVRWNLVTPAAVEVEPGGRLATLRHMGEELRLRVESPADASLAVQPVGTSTGLRTFGGAPEASAVYLEVPAPADGRVVLRVEFGWGRGGDAAD